MTLLLIFLVLLLVALVVLLLLPALSGQPYVPAAVKRIRRALELADLKPSEVFYDLGAGDGRALILAAREFHARAVGVELSPLLCSVAWCRIRAAGVSGAAHVRFGSYSRVDYSDADVIYLYLTGKNANRLKPMLAQSLKTGARVVCVSANLSGWQPERIDRGELLFLYRMPPVLDDQ